MPKTLSLNELQTRLQANPGIVMLEALPEKYYQDWHLPGARHMPHDTVDALAPALIPDKSSEVVVYCASNTCQNSHIAARVLTQLGYSNVAVYAGGKEEWHDAGLPAQRN